MATGSGAAGMNEVLATIGVPGISQPTFTAIEHEIGDLWKIALDADMKAAGEEERLLAIERNDYHDGVPAITVIADGGWSKRSHKHTYNALGGVGVIIGQATGNILHVGVRNKLCYICTLAETKNKDPQVHQCFKNWTDSSQSMEADILIEGFQKAESIHGVCFMRLIADGDSSVYARIQDEVPIWGRHVTKMECSNHACKCLRSSLEKLVMDKPHYKGRNKLTKLQRVRLTTAVRCAIRMRSMEPDRKTAARKLDRDIRNSVHHIFGSHDHCSSDFCRKKTADLSVTASSDVNPEVDNDFDAVLQDLTDYWQEGSSIQEQEESRLAFHHDDNIDCDMLRDISVLLDRLASKADRLIGNHTTNMAENWMSVRAKFDGGKMYNRCHRGSWHARCFGGSLRKNFGPAWSHLVWEQVMNTSAGPHLRKLYTRQLKQIISNRKQYHKPEFRKRLRDRRLHLLKQNTSKKARKEYGDVALSVTPDMTEEELGQQQKKFFAENVITTEARATYVEQHTTEQSLSKLWKEERRKRLTSSSFGSIMSRKDTTPVTPLVKNLQYSTFHGNIHTHTGLREESTTIQEYILYKSEHHQPVSVKPTGLRICTEHPFLAASTDGLVTQTDDGSRGLLEVKNVLLRQNSTFQQAASKSQFCLTFSNGSLHLKRTHKFYYQCQGQLQIFKSQWLDLTVRRTNPHQLHVERIFPDNELWQQEMLPKLEAFYFKALLPELSSPRYGKHPGIREPGQWFISRELKRRRRPEAGSSSSGVTHCARPSVSLRSSRIHKQTFCGRRIRHAWIVDEGTGKTEWYDGTVLGVTTGVDGVDGCVYQVLYDGDEDSFDVDHLIADFSEGSLTFIDI